MTNEKCQMTNGKSPMQVTNLNENAHCRTILEMRNITKTFPGVRALDGVSLDLQRVRFTRWLAKMALVSPP